MRRILAVIVLIGLVGSSGCFTPEAKRQWNSALGDLNGENTKNIAPLSKKSD
jgi:hypothetical protein